MANTSRSPPLKPVLPRGATTAVLMASLKGPIGKTRVSTFSARPTPRGAKSAFHGRGKLVAAMVVDSVGTGLFLPFVIVYFLHTTSMPLAVIGVSLSAGALAALPTPVAVGVADRPVQSPAVGGCRESRERRRLRYLPVCRLDVAARCSGVRRKRRPGDVLDGHSRADRGYHRVQRAGQLVRAAAASPQRRLWHRWPPRRRCSQHWEPLATWCLRPPTPLAI